MLYAGGGLWDADNGVRDLQTLLLENYAVESVRRWRGFYRDQTAICRAGDTLIIAGNAYNPDLGDASKVGDRGEGWIATLPAPAGQAPDPFDGDMLRKTAAFTPSASFKDHYNEFILTYR